MWQESHQLSASKSHGLLVIAYPRIGRFDITKTQRTIKCTIALSAFMQSKMDKIQYFH